MANVLEPEWTDGGDSDGAKRAQVGGQVGARRLGLSVYELPAGDSPWPYHYHHANEELLVVLSGRLHVRTPQGWQELEPGSVVGFPRGPVGAHQVENRGEEPARYLILSEMNAPEAVVYPDSEKVRVMTRAPGGPDEEDQLIANFRLADAVDYWEGERRGPGG
ncbi:MAG: cupin domain-containing protein [Solirubrobacterales bacterium]